MINNAQLEKMTRVYGVPDTDFSEWPKRLQGYITDEYFNCLALVERAELQNEAMAICEDFNPFTQPEMLIEALQVTIRNMLFNQVQERVRCLQ